MLPVAPVMSTVFIVISPISDGAIPPQHRLYRRDLLLLEWMLGGDFFIDLHTEAGGGWQLPVAIDAADRSLHDIGVPRHTAGDFLQDGKVRHCRTEMEADNARDRSHRVVRTDANTKGGSGRRDLLADGEAATMTEVWLHKGDCAQAAKILIFPVCDQALPGGDRAFRELCNLRHGDVITGLDWLFDEHRACWRAGIDIGQRRP